MKSKITVTFDKVYGLPSVKAVNISEEQMKDAYILLRGEAKKIEKAPAHTQKLGFVKKSVRFAKRLCNAVISSTSATRVDKRPRHAEILNFSMK